MYPNLVLHVHILCAFLIFCSFYSYDNNAILNYMWLMIYTLFIILWQIFPFSNSLLMVWGKSNINLTKYYYNLSNTWVACRLVFHSDGHSFFYFLPNLFFFFSSLTLEFLASISLNNSNELKYSWVFLILKWICLQFFH